MKEASMANCEQKSGDYTGQTTIISKSGKAPQVIVAKGGSSAVPNVGDRLHSQVHICNHARCAANDPNYNVKAVTAPKKFLVAKKHHYGGLDEKGEKTKSSTSSDHDQSHALHSLTNSVPQPKNDKVRSNIPLSKGRNVEQHSRARDNIIVPDKKKGAERKVRPITSSSSAKSSGRNSGSVVTESRSTSNDRRHPQPIRKLKVGSTDSVLSIPTEKGWQGEDSSSPKSSLTSISITQIVSTSRGEEVGEEGGEEEGEEEGEMEREMEREVEQAAAAVSSPTASVGSNHDTEEATSSLKETVTFLDCSETLEPALEDSTSESSDVSSESPAGETPSSNSQKSSVTEEATITHDSPSPSAPSGPGVTESTTPSSASSYSRPSISFASITTPEGSSVTTSGPAGEILSLSLKTIPAGEDVTPELHTPSVASGQSTVSESPTSVITSDKSRPSPSSASSTTTPGRSPLTTPPTSASKQDTNLKESSNIRGAQSSSAASAKKPTRVTKLSVSPAPVDSSSALAPAAPSQLARRFISDLQGSSAARKPASTKGVRSIELRGGKAQNYSKTTVTSWNLTTTTVESSPSISEHSPAKNAGSRISRRGSAPTAAIKRAWQSSSKENPVAIGPNSSTEIVELAKEGGPTGLKFARRARSMTVFNDVLADSEIVSLKHGEVAERRLSEEWMTNHALEDAVKKIADKDHRVKVLVHAFETLASLSDSDGPGSEDTPLNTQLEYEVLSATPIAA